MRRCLRGKIISLSLVGLGGFLMGASVGIALGSGEDRFILAKEGDKFPEPVGFDFPKDHKDVDDYIRAESLKLCMKAMFKEDIEEEIDDDVEIINENPYLDEDGVLIKETTEGLVEVTEPYVISIDEFSDPNVFGEFERNTLVYYEEDDVLTTDRDEIITNVEEMVGPNALTSFGDQSDNKDIVYVRNVKLGCNFEIVREEGSYQELVLGLPSEDDEYEKARKFFKNLDEKEYVGDNIGGRD